MAADHSGLILTLTIVGVGLLVLGVIAAGLLFVGSASVAPAQMAAPAQVSVVASGSRPGRLIDSSELRRVRFDALVAGDGVLLGPRVLRVQSLAEAAMTVEHVAQATRIDESSVVLTLNETREILTYARQECDVQEMFRLPAHLADFLAEDPAAADPADSEPAVTPAPLPAEQP